MILMRLLGLVKPLLKYMALAVCLGVMGHLMAFLLPVLGLYLFQVEYQLGILILLVFAGISRGFFRYGEQYLNHFIAFKILARLRSIVFTKLRSLGEGLDRGTFVTLISSDIELLEVFFAHTISPIMIAIIFNGLTAYLLYQLNPVFALIGMVAYLIVGLLIPLVFSKFGANYGARYRDSVSNLNSFSLEGIQGIKEILDYGLEESFLNNLNRSGLELKDHQKKMKGLAGLNKACCDLVILGSVVLVVVLGSKNGLDLTTLLFGFVILLSSFGPVMALSQLTNNLYLTRSSASRVLNLLDQEAILTPVHNDKDIVNGDICLEDVSFSYDEKRIFDSINTVFKKGTIIGIKGQSGSGKSTLLKLLMRRYQVNNGLIKIGDDCLETIDSGKLKDFESVMFQSTDIFKDSVYNNIVLARSDASELEVIEAMQRAQLHDFVEKRHDLILESMGTNISSGEAQRIGLARIFLHGGDLILLDEPTANLDALNEAMILQAIKRYQDTRTIIIVSHRDSTLKLANNIITMESLLR